MTTTLMQQLQTARIHDLEQPRYFGMPIDPSHLLPQKGVYIMENLNLQTLAEARQYEFAFVGIPLKLRGATGSPFRPLALVE